MFGYDPYFMAGYPVGVWNSMGKKGFEIAHMFLPFVPLPMLFYLVIVFLCLSAPLVLWVSLRRACPSPRASRILLLLSIAFWQLSTHTSYFWKFGNAFYPFTACLLVPMTVLAWGILQGRQGWWRSLLLALVGAAIFYFHPVLMVAALPILAAAAIGGRAGLRSARTWGWVIFSGALFSVLASFWLIPLLQQTAVKVAVPKAWWQGGPKYLVMDLLSDRVYRQHFDRNFLLHAAVVLGCSGAIIAWRRRTMPVMVLLAMGAIGSLGIAYGLPFLHVARAIQPYRFLVPATLLFLGPMAVSVDTFFDAFPRWTRSARITVALLLVVMAPAGTAYLVDLTVDPLPCGVTKSQNKALETIQRFAVNGRIACDEFSLGDIIPYTCGKSVIGGASAQAFLKHRFAGMDDDGLLFGHPPAEWPPEELMSALRRYAVDFAVFSRPEWKKYAEVHPNVFAFKKQCGEYKLYRVRGAEPSLAMTGGADVAADYNRIDVADVQGTNLVLKLHYADWLTANEGVALYPVDVPEDPVPFIGCRIPVGVTRFAITKAMKRRTAKKLSCRKAPAPVDKDVGGRSAASAAAAEAGRPPEGIESPDTQGGAIR